MAKNKTQPERRRHKRAKTQALVIAINGREYSTANLSIGGSLVEGYDGPLTAGALFSVEGIGSSGEKLTKVEIRARVNRADHEARQLAVTFLDLDSGAYEILLDAMAKRIEGLSRPRTPIKDQP